MAKAIYTFKRTEGWVLEDGEGEVVQKFEISDLWGLAPGVERSLASGDGTWIAHLVARALHVDSDDVEVTDVLDPDPGNEWSATSEWTVIVTEEEREI